MGINCFLNCEPDAFDWVEAHVAEENEKSVTKLGSLTIELIEQTAGKVDNTQDIKIDDEIYSKKVDDFLKMNQEYNDLAFKKAMETKVVTFPDLNFLSITTAQIKELKTEDLLKFLCGEAHKGAIHESTIQLISNEILSRQIKEAAKPHWTITPTFIVGCIASVLAAISILVTIYFSVFYKN